MSLQAVRFNYVTKEIETKEIETKEINQRYSTQYLPELKTDTFENKTKAIIQAKMDSDLKKNCMSLSQQSCYLTSTPLGPGGPGGPLSPRNP